MDKRLTKADAIRLLIEKQQALAGADMQRYPRRSDFPADEVAAIKAFLGPWPRALEAAGLKPARDDGRAEKIRQKRIAQRRKRRIARFGAPKSKQQ